MKKSVKLREYLCILICGFCINNCSALNQLCKVFHHDLSSSQLNSGSIELGKVVFYFLQNPEIKMVSDKNNQSKKQLTFLFPSTEIKSKECIEMIKNISLHQSKWYTVFLKSIKKPVVGLSLSIIFDPSEIECAYDTFDAISLYKGIVFTFYDKKLLEGIKVKTNPIIRMASHEIKPSVIIDCGHGGRDTGAIGCQGVKEKNITLNIGIQLAALLKEKGIDTILTRDKDVFVPLDKRTRSVANCSRNSIFVSIHANYAQNQMASGIETFCLSPPLLKCDFKTTQNYETKLLECVMCNKYKKSQLLARSIHDNVISVAREKNKKLVDRHVKNAVSQVLLGSCVPAILIELGFVSNKRESTLLQQREYQQTLVKGICAGVFSYFKNI